MKPRKTYWHLLHQKRVPSEYEIASSRLLYYTARGFEVDVAVKEWYARHQSGSPLSCSDWEKFRDPMETTYTKYTSLRDARETFLDELLESEDARARGRELSSVWLEGLDRFLAPSLFPLHGLQMTASYLGQMAPGGRIVIAAMFQAADEIRRVQRIAHRVRQLQLTHADLGRDCRILWLDDAAWQPLRRAVELLLVTYDWGECFVGLNLALKPVMDDMIATHLASLARAYGDDLSAMMLRSLNEDSLWHRDWSRALVRTVIEDTPANTAVIQGWLARWLPLALEAAEPFSIAFAELREAAKMPSCDALAEAKERCARYLVSAGLSLPASLAQREQSAPVGELTVALAPTVSERGRA